MPNQPAPGRRKLTVWMDGRLLDRYKALAPPRSLAGVLARAVEAEVERLENGRPVPDVQKRPEGPSSPLP